MTIKIGINGLGRIGRMVIRSLIENNNKKIEIKHINSRSSAEVMASLLKYDSIHGKFNSEIKHGKNHLNINNKKITFSQYSNLNEIKWKNFGVDYVLECTGKFNSKDKLITHIKNGAKKVIVSAPCKNADKTIVYGVNNKSINKNDLLIVGSGSGETETLVTITDKAKSLGVTIVLFTSNRSSKIAKQSRIVLAINSPSPKLKNNHGNKSIQPMGSLFEQSLMIILDSCILYLTKIMDMESTKMFVKHANLE